MIRTIRFLDAASAQRFAKALQRPTEFQVSRSFGDGTGFDLSNPRESALLGTRYALATIVQRRGATVRTDAGESVIHEGMLRAHALASGIDRGPEWNPLRSESEYLEEIAERDRAQG